MTILKKIADAMRKEWVERGGALDFDAMAIEALRAIRDPSEAMIAKDYDCIIDFRTENGGEYITAPDLETVWQFMIDRAIAEGTK